MPMETNKMFKTLLENGKKIKRNCGAFSALQNLSTQVSTGIGYILFSYSAITNREKVKR